jgi:hypothetical protein
MYIKLWEFCTICNSHAEKALSGAGLATYAAICILQFLVQREGKRNCRRGKKRPHVWVGLYI